MRDHLRRSTSPLGSVATRYQHPLARAKPKRNRLIFLEAGPIEPFQDTAPGQFERDSKLSTLEAVLFLAKEPIHPRKLSQLANLADGTEALTLVSRLNRLYDQAARAFRVEEVAGGMQLRTRRQFGNWLRRLQHVPREIRLSPPAMETLAVVAYRQPVVRADIEQVRGVSCGEILRQLMERDLVRVCGRSDELGRPYFYGTTNRFLQIFGLGNLEELPRAEQFRRSLEDNGQMVTQQNGDGDVDVTVATDNERLITDEVTRAAMVVAMQERSEDEEWDDEDEEWVDDDEDLEDDDDLEEDEEWEDEDDDDEEELDDDEEWEDEDAEEFEYDAEDDDDEEDEEDEELDDDEEWEEVDDDELGEDEEWDDEDDEDEEDEDWEDDDEDWEED